METERGQQKAITFTHTEVRITAKEFLGILETDIKKMIDVGLQYWAFVIICQAIELIGAFYDDEPFEQKRRSKSRFKKGMDCMPKREEYRDPVHQDDLYHSVRCPLVHQTRPSTLYRLASIRDGWSRSAHLTKQGDHTLLVVEAFCADFCEACERVRGDLADPSSDISAHKAQAGFLRIGRTAEDAAYASSGAPTPVCLENVATGLPTTGRHRGKRSSRRAERRKKGWVG